MNIKAKLTFTTAIAVVAGMFFLVSSRAHAQGTSGISSKTKIIAHERYKFLQRLKPKLGLLPLYTFGTQYYTALFPIGRFDRVYLLCHGAFHDFGKAAQPPREGVLLPVEHLSFFCFQRENGKDNLVYNLTLDENPKVSGGPKRISSLLDFLHYHRLDAVGLNDSARADLASKQEYIQYSADSASEYLTIELVSGLPYNYAWDKGKVAKFNLEEDPATHKKLPGYDVKGDDAFFSEYGLPVIPEELKLPHMPSRVR